MDDAPLPGAAVGIDSAPPHCLYFAPFMPAEESRTQQALEDIDWLRELGGCVHVDRLGAMFDRACPKPVRRLSFVAWLCVRGDLCCDATAGFLEDMVASPDVPLRETKALRALTVDKPSGLLVLLRYLVGRPTQRARGFRPAAEPAAPVAAQQWFQPVSRPTAGPRFEDASLPRLLPSACETFDAALVTLKLDELLALFTRQLGACTAALGADAQAHELLDSFGALVHACLSSDFELGCRSDGFASAEVREDYDKTRAPILAVWNVLMRQCSKVQPTMLRATTAVYRLHRDLIVAKGSGRVNTAFARGVQTLALFSVLAHTFPLVVTWVAPAPVTALPSWLFGLKHFSEEAVAYAAAMDGMWEVASRCVSYRRAALEVHCQLGAQVAARSRCCFSDHVVFGGNAPALPHE